MRRKDQSRLGGWIIVGVAAIGVITPGSYFLLFMAMAVFAFNGIGQKKPTSSYIAGALYGVGALLSFNPYITIILGCVVGVGVYLAVQGTKPVPGVFR